MGLFRDFLPSSRICNSLFQSALGFSLALGVFRYLSVLPSLFSAGCEDTSSVVSVVFMQFHSLFPSSGCCCGQSQPPDPFQNGAEQLSRNRHFRHLEDYLLGMAHDLRTDLDQFLPQRRQRSVPASADVPVAGQSISLIASTFSCEANPRNPGLFVSAYRWVKRPGGRRISSADLSSAAAIKPAWKRK